MGNNAAFRLTGVLIIFLCIFLPVTGFFDFSDPLPQPELPLQKELVKIDLKNGDIFLFMEAITRIKNDDLFLDPAVNREEILRDTIKSYLPTIDPFSAYLSRDEYLKFKESLNENYAGIGMEIEKTANDEFICFPYPESPAERAGIKAGDRLKSINGMLVKGKSLFTVATLARDQIGTALVVITNNGVEKKVNIVRSKVRIEEVSRQWFGNFGVIRILSFTQNTKVRLKSIIDDWKKPIIIDLRNNSGGDLHAAIDAAMLFLEKAKPIVTVKSRSDLKTYESTNRGVNLTSPLYLWQNELTASAAEVFIAALTQNHRAVSIGKTTSGKGTKQDILELSDGSALVITTGYLLTPNGTEYQGRGLVPTYSLEKEHPQTEDYLAKLREVITMKEQGFLFDQQHNHS
jgi:carboxyl-terminal processing protease